MRQWEEVEGSVGQCKTGSQWEAMGGGAGKAVRGIRRQLEGVGGSGWKWAAMVGNGRQQEDSGRKWEAVIESGRQWKGLESGGKQ